MNIGDYTYIIIGVAAMIVSAVNKNAKRKKAKARKSINPDDNQQLDSQSSSGNINHIFEEYLQDVEKNKEPEAYVADQMLQPELEGVSAIKDVELPMNEGKAEDNVNNNTESSNDIQSDFDLKSAIIYSEILNNPYD